MSQNNQRGHAVPRSRLAAAVKGVLDLTHRVTRPAFVDVEHVPEQGPFMLVGNHQLLGMQDLPALVRGLEVHRGVRVRGMADHFHFAIPGWRDLLVRFGAVPGTRENCVALLAAGQPVLVFPGGAREVYKRRNQRYQLLWGQRLGFARIAIAAGCPIIPFAAVGAEDRFDVLLDTDSRIAAPLRAVTHRAGRPDVGTLLVKGSTLGVVPGTGRLYFRFSAPIPTTQWAGRADDPHGLRECRDLVKAEVEAGIAALLALRDRDPHRSLPPRLANALRGAVPV